MKYLNNCLRHSVDMLDYSTNRFCGIRKQLHILFYSCKTTLLVSHLELPVGSLLLEWTYYYYFQPQKKWKWYMKNILAIRFTLRGSLDSHCIYHLIVQLSNDLLFCSIMSPPPLGYVLWGAGAKKLNSFLSLLCCPNFCLMVKFFNELWVLSICTPYLRVLYGEGVNINSNSS